MGVNLKSNEQFIIDCKKIHKSKYDYSLVEYRGSKYNIKLICRKHGAFDINAAKHLAGSICRKCVIDSYKSNTKDFIFKSKQIHGDRFDYSLVEYKKSSIKVKIICKTHGVFSQTPNSHLRGVGCDKCRVSYKLTTEEFIRRAKLKHGDRYNYSSVVYSRSNKKVNIICNIHGEFLQTPNAHLVGRGCSRCGFESKNKNHEITPIGWRVSSWVKSSKTSRTFDSFKVYIIKCYNDNEEFYKVGRTFNTVKRRFKSGMPYNYEILKELIFDTAKEAFDYENKLKKENFNNKYIPKIKFPGNTECFNKIK